LGGGQHVWTDIWAIGVDSPMEPAENKGFETLNPKPPLKPPQLWARK